MKSRQLCPKTAARGPYVFASAEVDEREGVPGTVVTSWVRCGKPACRCATGRPHGPYFYHRWREDVYEEAEGGLVPAGRRQRRRYVPRHDAPRVAALCARYRARHPSLRELVRMLRTMDGMLARLAAQEGEGGR